MIASRYLNAPSLRAGETRSGRRRGRRRCGRSGSRSRARGVRRTSAYTSAMCFSLTLYAVELDEDGPLAGAGAVAKEHVRVGLQAGTRAELHPAVTGRRVVPRVRTEVHDCRGDGRPGCGTRSGLSRSAAPDGVTDQERRARSRKAAVKTRPHDDADDPREEHPTVHGLAPVAATQSTLESLISSSPVLTWWPTTASTSSTRPGRSA